ncbi:hypothetical protein EMGBD4_02650 [Verrucomicrobiota bacterium]|nr:hypothetical protein EMGBD4_02650 [Verrucomicrobiota bacterium]
MFIAEDAIKDQDLLSADMGVRVEARLRAQWTSAVCPVSPS